MEWLPTDLTFPLSRPACRFPLGMGVGIRPFPGVLLLSWSRFSFLSAMLTDLGWLLGLSLSRGATGLRVLVFQIVVLKALLILRIFRLQTLFTWLPFHLGFTVLFHGECFCPPMFGQATLPKVSSGCRCITVHDLVGRGRIVGVSLLPFRTRCPLLPLYMVPLLLIFGVLILVDPSLLRGRSSTAYPMRIPLLNHFGFGHEFGCPLGLLLVDILVLGILTVFARSHLFSLNLTFPRFRRFLERGRRGWALRLFSEILDHRRRTLGEYFLAAFRCSGDLRWLVHMRLRLLEALRLRRGGYTLGIPVLLQSFRLTASNLYRGYVVLLSVSIMARELIWEDWDWLVHHLSVGLSCLVFRPFHLFRIILLSNDLGLGSSRLFWAVFPSFPAVLYSLRGLLRGRRMLDRIRRCLVLLAELGGPVMPCGLPFLESKRVDVYLYLYETRRLIRSACVDILFMIWLVLPEGVFSHLTWGCRPDGDLFPFGVLELALLLRLGSCLLPSSSCLHINLSTHS